MMDLLYATHVRQSVVTGMSGARSPVGSSPNKACQYHVGCQHARGHGEKGLVPAQDCVGHLEVDS